MASNGEESKNLSEFELKKLELEIQKFEFEKQSEAQKQELQRSQLRQAGRDTIWRVVVGTIISGVIVGAVTIHGNLAKQSAEERASIAEQAAGERAAQDRKSEVLVQLVNARESADSTLRAEMLKALLEHYFKRDDDFAKITLLEMIALNFRDSVQVKPMFEQLDREFESEEKTTARKELRNAAKTIIADQLGEIRYAPDGAVCFTELQKGAIESPDCYPALKFQLVDVDRAEAAIKMRVNSKNGQLLPEDSIRDGDSFEVTYFDMPMTDYTVIDEGSSRLRRYSIVLRDIPAMKDEAQDKAKIGIAVLPVDSYSTQQEYKFDEIVSEFLATNDPLSVETTEALTVD